MADTKRIVVALGGNALGKTPEEQLQLIKDTAVSLVNMIEAGHEVMITHGNGPQVGMIKVATDEAAKNGSSPTIPFAECGAMSQGYIGYHLAQALDNELNKRKIDREVSSIVTQTVVDEKDPAFENPTKPVGAMLTKEEADKAAAETGNKYVEDSGRGWRWVVASPRPTRVVESKVIDSLMKDNIVVIASGGGGIPVVEREDGLSGVPAVIDKDLSASLLARQIDADQLVILTAVENIAVNFNKPDEKQLDEVTVEEMRKHADDGQFAPGSMLPKVEACLEFVESGDARSAIVTSLEKSGEALEGKAGTHIVNK